VHTERNILVQASKILPSVSPVYGLNLSLSRQHNGDIPGDKRKEIENKTCQSVKWMKGVTL
jgi:hypothetical protein